MKVGVPRLLHRSNSRALPTTTTTARPPWRATRHFRPTEVETLLGDPSKTKRELGWIPEITLDEMITEMVDHDLSEAKQRALLKAHGYKVAVSRE